MEEENLKTNQYYSTRKTGVLFGLYAGFLGVSLFMLKHIFGQFDINTTEGPSITQYIFSFLEYAIIIGVVILSHKEFIAKGETNQMTYLQGLGISAITGITSGLILTLFMLFYVNVINTEFLNQLIEIAITDLERQALNDEQMEMSVKITEMILSPKVYYFMTLFSNFFLIFLSSLIITIFTKKVKEI